MHLGTDEEPTDAAPEFRCLTPCFRCALLYLLPVAPSHSGMWPESGGAHLASLFSSFLFYFVHYLNTC